MTDGTMVAIIAGSQLVLITMVNGFLLARKDRRDAELRRLEKTEDYARQDEVAMKAAEAAALLAKTQHALIERADEAARRSEQSRAEVTERLTTLDEQGKKIHILVNSDMTAARTNERDQTRLTLMALRRVQALSSNLGLVADQGENDAIVAAEKRIEELDLILADRHAAQLAVEAEAEAIRLKS